MLIYLEQTDSTNDALKKLLEHKKLEKGSILYTDYQTIGRGQSNTVWESEPNKNLLMSMVLYPTIKPEQQFLISKLISIAIIDYLKEIHTFALKWPNDIYAEGKKIGGLLIEYSWLGKNLEYVVVGLGLNVNQEIFKNENAISLKLIKKVDFQIKDLIICLQAHILRWLDCFELKEKAIHQKYQDALIYYQQKHLFTLPSGEKFNGIFNKINQNGSIEILHLEENKTNTYTNKEIKF